MPDPVLSSRVTARLAPLISEALARHGGDLLDPEWEIGLAFPQGSPVPGLLLVVTAPALRTGARLVGATFQGAAGWLEGFGRGGPQAVEDAVRSCCEQVRRNLAAQTSIAGGPVAAG